MHICDHHIKAYYNIEKRKLVKIETYRGGQKFIGGGQKFIGGGGDRNGPVPTLVPIAISLYSYYRNQCHWSFPSLASIPLQRRKTKTDQTITIYIQVLGKK